MHLLAPRAVGSGHMSCKGPIRPCFRHGPCNPCRLPPPPPPPPPAQDYAMAHQEVSELGGGGGVVSMDTRTRMSQPQHERHHAQRRAAPRGLHHHAAGARVRGWCWDSASGFPRRMGLCVSDSTFEPQLRMSFCKVGRSSSVAAAAMWPVSASSCCLPCFVCEAWSERNSQMLCLGNRAAAAAVAVGAAAAGSWWWWARRRRVRRLM